MPETQDWTNVLAELPPADLPVRVRDDHWTFSNAAYCAEANDWYVHRPGHPTHGHLYADVFGPEREVIEWLPL